MKFERCGMYKKNLMIKLNANEFLIHNLLRDLENIIAYIKKTSPVILNEFLEKLSVTLKSRVKNNEIIHNLKFQEFIADYKNLVKNQDLIKLGFNFFKEILEISEEEIWNNEDADFTSHQMSQAANEFYYLEMKTLIDILGRDEAINYYKQVILNFIHTYDTNQINVYESLEDLRERTIRFLNKGTLGRVRLFSEVENGQLIEICKNCEKVEFLDKELREDKELLYTLCCDVHIPLAKMWNENFVLTLDYTIAKGDSYCTYVYHDTRFVDEIKHHPKEFFDEVVSNFE